MYLSCLTTSTIAVPCPDLIYSNTTNCCYTVTCQLKLSSGQPSRTISAIYTGSPTCPFNILEINGIPFVNPLATPIVLNQGQSITLVIESCPCSGVGNCYVGELYIDYTDVGGAGTEQIDFGLTEINPQALAYDPIPVALTAIDIYPCIGTSGCTDMIAGSVPFDNVSSFEVPLFIDDIGSNLPLGTAYYMDGVLQSGNTIIVPPKTAVTISFGFCWPNSTPTNFDIDFNVCDVYSRRITFNVEPVTCIDCGISCSDFEIKTENTYLPDFAAGCGFTLPNIYTEAAVGEKKTFLWTYVYADGFNNGNIEIFFNPYLFTNIDTIAPVDPYDLAIPSVGWYIKTYPYMIGTGFIDMVQKTNNQYQPSQQNELVRISIIDDYQFQIEFTFYMMMDIDNGMTNTYLENWKKLWFNNIYAVNNGDFITFGNDVYKATSANPRYFAQDFMLIDNSILVAPKKPKRCYFYGSFPIRARWYNKGLSVTTSEFSNPTFWFYRNSLPLATPSFSIFDNTEVEFWINIPSGATPNAMVAYVMDLNRFDNTIDWQSNYDFSRAEITTIGAPGIIDNNIESPSTGPTNIGGNVWKIRFTVGNQVRSTGAYAIGIIVYDDTNNIVNTFSYPDPTLNQTYIPVDLTPSEDALCCPLGKESVWNDYINTYVDKWPFATTYKQRLRHYLNLTGGQFSSICLDDFGYTGLWTDLIVDVTLNIYQKRPLGNYGLNAHAFFMYYQLQSIKQAGYPDGYNNLSPMFTVQDLGGGNLRMTWEGRPRWESWSQLPLSNVLVSDDNTEYNRLPAGPVGTQYLNDFNISWDWSNPTVLNWPGEIYLEYVIKFDLTYVLNLPNYTPFYVNKVILERLDVFKEEPNLPTAGTYYPVPQRFDPLLIEGWNGSAYITIVGPVCADQYEHIKVTFTSTGGGEVGTVVAFISKPPYGLAALKEDDDASASGTGFTQLDSQYIYDVSVGVQTGLWEFKIDVNALPADNYEICALFIPDI